MNFTEIERKFLIDPTKIPYDLSTIEYCDIIQGYASTNFELIYRLRKSEYSNEDIEYYQTIKGKGTKIRKEVETELTEEQFDDMWIACEDITLEKRRYKTGPDVYDLDQYKGVLAPLWTVEVEFDTIESCDNFTPPKWFGEEVTEDVRYTNLNLAINGLP